MQGTAVKLVAQSLGDAVRDKAVAILALALTSPSELTPPEAALAVEAAVFAHFAEQGVPALRSVSFPPCPVAIAPVAQPSVLGLTSVLFLLILLQLLPVQPWLSVCAFPAFLDACAHFAKPNLPGLRSVLSCLPDCKCSCSQARCAWLDVCAVLLAFVATCRVARIVSSHSVSTQLPPNVIVGDK